MNPTVTIALPVLNEEVHLDRTLDSIEAQTYPRIVEVLVADGGSGDRTRAIAAARPGVRVIDNPGVTQAAGLNRILASARGEIIVRVDGHCMLASDYVARCVEALDRTAAALVGGPMVPEGDGPMSRSVGHAMSSAVGAGPARFHVSGDEGWVDTVYLGAYRAELAREAGGYAEDVGVNEDGEFAIRMTPYGGVWFTPAISSRYVPRSSIPSLSRQFFRYGRSRAATVRRHPSAVKARQLAAPALLVGLLSPWRRIVAPVYLGVLAFAAIGAFPDRDIAGRLPIVMATMHLSWGAGFFVGVVAPPRAPARTAGFGLGEEAA